MTRRNVSIFENYKTVPNHSTLHIIQQVQRFCFPTVVCLPCICFYEVFLNFVLIKYSLCEGYQLIIGCHFEDTQLIKYSDCKDLLAGSDSFNEFDSNQLLGRDCPILFHGQMSFLLQFLSHLGPSNSVSSLHVLNFSVCCSSDQILFRSHSTI